MAETVGTGRGRRRDSKGELPEHDAEAGAPPAQAENRAGETDMQRWFAVKKNAERTYEGVLAKVRETKTAAKAVRDKANSDCADAMKSRGITKQMFQELYEESNRKEEEVRIHYQNKLWAMRAIGLAVGQQLGFFEDGFGGQDEALRRARQAGYDAFTDKKPDSANPHGPSTVAGQKWLEGYNAAGADSLKPN